MPRKAMSMVEAFRAYESVRVSGMFNMITDRKRAAQKAGLSYPLYWHILKNYTAIEYLYRVTEEVANAQK